MSTFFSTSAHRNSHRSILGTIFAGVTLCGSLTTVSPAFAHTSQYQVVDSETSHVTSDLVRTVTTVQVGDEPINRFQMYRVTKDVSPHAHRGAMLILPPLTAGFQNYEVGEDGDY